MRLRIFSLLTLAVLFCSIVVCGQQPAAATRATGVAVPAEQLLSALPADLQEAGSGLLRSGDERVRARLARKLAATGETEALEFLITALESEPSAVVRGEIADELGKRPHPNVRQALERRLESGVEASDVVAGVAFRRLIGNQGYTLPGPLHLGRLKAEDERVRVLVFGDFGNGSPMQRQVAAEMLEYHRRSPFDFGLTVGDNFYRTGLSSPVHPRWQTQWENLYTRLGIAYYAVLGNHDTDYDWRSPFAQVLRTKRSESWRMPAPYYTFTAGPAQFFALDTNQDRLTENQLDWLDDELQKSDARWKIVYGHHPLKSDGEHGDDAYTERVRALLLPRLKQGGANVYLSGHDHDMQALEPEGELHLFISGGGGKASRPLRRAHHRLWGQSANGFTVVEVEEDVLAVSFVGPGGKQLCKMSLRKGQTATADCPR